MGGSNPSIVRYNLGGDPYSYKLHPPSLSFWEALMRLPWIEGASLFNYIYGILANKKCVRLLDVGGGVGVYSAWLASRLEDALGVGIYTLNLDASIRVARAIRPAAFRGLLHRINDVEANFLLPLPLAPHSVDLVILKDILPHVPSLPKFFEEIFRVIRPPGLVLLIYHPLARIEGQYTYLPEDAVRGLERVGFRQLAGVLADIPLPLDDWYRGAPRIIMTAQKMLK